MNFSYLLPFRLWNILFKEFCYICWIGAINNLLILIDLLQRSVNSAALISVAVLSVLLIFIFVNDSLKLWGSVRSLTNLRRYRGGPPRVSLMYDICWPRSLHRRLPFVSLHDAPQSECFCFIQLQHWLASLLHTSSYPFQKTTSEHICQHFPSSPGLISTLYASLNSWSSFTSLFYVAQ